MRFAKPESGFRNGDCVQINTHEGQVLKTKRFRFND